MQKFTTLESIAACAAGILDQLIPEKQVCALVDFPDHANVGDSAILLGERIYLDRRSVNIQYVCSVDTFSESALRAHMPSGTILIHGGGNFGTLWPRHQALRERILLNFPEHKVIQLPQSLYFEDKESLKRVASLVKSHPDFTLLVRDSASLDIARDGLGIDAILCPDSALFLSGRLQRGLPVVDCVGLCRTDKEKQFNNLPEALLHRLNTVEVDDWLNEPFNTESFFARNLGRLSRYGVFRSEPVQRRMLSLWDKAAEQRVERGCIQLSRGKVVVTDRLHAQILALLMGIPSISLDNNYRKIGNYLDTWFSGIPNCQRVDSLDRLPAALAEYGL
jgi:pyruvyl transferase EpsO